MTGAVNSGLQGLWKNMICDNAANTGLIMNLHECDVKIWSHIF